MSSGFTRRNMVLGSAAMLAAGRATKLQAAQAAPDFARLLGDALPAQLRSILPQEAVQAAEMVREVLALEQQAKALRLPPSPLDWPQRGLPTDPEQLYEQAMPRLVALIDRAGHAGPLLGEQAGSVLARLHLTQHRTPDLWRSAASTAYSGGVQPLFLADSQPDNPAAMGLKIDIPAQTGPTNETTPSSVLPPVATSLRFADLANEYAAWFAAARIRPEHQESAAWHLTMIRESRPRYMAVGQRMGVPWYFIAAIHGLEASFNFRAHLHNGDFPLSRRTHQVPAGRPRVWMPPSDWENSASDALQLMGFTGQDDWSLPRLLHRLEAYNGFGYRRVGRASPYLWSFSTLYDRGKFVADGKFDPRARSQQCGAAVMLRVLADAGELPV